MGLEGDKPSDPLLKAFVWSGTNYIFKMRLTANYNCPQFQRADPVIVLNKKIIKKIIFTCGVESSECLTYQSTQPREFCSNCSVFYSK